MFTKFSLFFFVILIQLIQMYPKSKAIIFFSIYLPDRFWPNQAISWKWVILFVFLVQIRTRKYSFEIYWPLRYWKCIPECTKNLTMKYTSKHLIIVYFCIYMGCLYDWFRENSLPFFVNNWSNQRIAGEKLNLLRVIKTMN